MQVLTSITSFEAYFLRYLPGTKIFLVAGIAFSLLTVDVPEEGSVVPIAVEATGGLSTSVTVT